MSISSSSFFLPWRILLLHGWVQSLLPQPRQVGRSLSYGSSKVNPRAAFGSMKEAITHFESSEGWVHLHKTGVGVGDTKLQNIGNVDIKKVEELMRKI
ncbi:hypothetical protein SAY87_027594 [Trapa incisa]|uniref:Uncharacterized protein n=1 Tax=Trapa incisa TaxID=236973 RepID=A0AAN7JMS7_9MYRT|nr:hypothetical protein SAY87_027594 [Trapa incisa]